MSQTFDINEWNDIAFWGFLMSSYGVAVLTTILMHEMPAQWYDQLRKPSWSPPPVVFSLVWFILFFIIAFAGYRGNKMAATDGYRRGLNSIYAIQLFLLLIWALVFFGARDVASSFWILVLLAIVVFIWICVMWMVDRFSAYLLILYFLWLVFACILHYQILIDNRRPC